MRSPLLSEFERQMLWECVKGLLTGVALGCLVILGASLLIGCTTTNINIPPNSTVGNITVDASKTITTSPSVQADGNTVPVSAVP